MDVSLKSGCVVVAVAAGLTVPATAAAQSGAIPDPNSPAGKEYALPLDQGRAQGGGGSHGGGSHGGGAGSHGGARPLFGAGISPAHHESRSSSGPQGGTAPGSHGSTKPSRSVSGSSSTALRLRPTAHESSTGQPALLVVFVLLGGVLLAGGFRLVGRRSPPPAGAA